VVGKPVILLLISFENFAFVPVYSAINLVGSVIRLKGSLDHRKFMLMPDVLRINGIKITLAKAQVMNGIQYIGLSNAIVSNKTIYPWGK
jgi:hypothetical protein